MADQYTVCQHQSGCIQEQHLHLDEENRRLREKVAIIKTDNHFLVGEIARMANKIAELKNKIAELKNTCTRQDKLIKATRWLKRARVLATPTHDIGGEGGGA